MIMGDKKKVAALIVSRLKKPEGSLKDANHSAFAERAGATEEKPKDEGKISAAEEMIQAIHSKDAEGFALALSDFMQMAQEEPEAEGDEETSHPILG